MERWLFLLGPGVLAVVAAIVGVWDKLAGGVRKAMILGSLTVAVAVLTQSMQVTQRLSQDKELAERTREANDANVFVNSTLLDIDEASGGAIDPQTNIAYIVDDDETRLFRLRFDEEAQSYIPLQNQGLPIQDRRPCASRAIWQRPKRPPCDVATPTILDDDDVEDLEGAAFYKGKLLVVSSLGNSNQGRPEDSRLAVLELNTDGHITDASRALPEVIRSYFKAGLPCQPQTVVSEWRDEGQLQVMRVEGLTVDKDGLAYLGFRAPLVQEKYALVLRTPVEQLFLPSPSFESFLLPLYVADSDRYGVVSLDYDESTNEILVLGNSRTRQGQLPPRVWAWTPSSCKEVQKVQAFTGDLFSSIGAPGSRPAKPEVLLVPSPGLLDLLFDAQGTGGQKRIRHAGKVLLASTVK